MILKSKIQDIDYSRYYFEFNDTLLDFAETDEHELYALPFSSPLIFNEPYEEDYERLKKSGRPITQDDYTKACKHYFMTQGFSQSEAYSHAKEMLKRTRIFNPSQKS